MADLSLLADLSVFPVDRQDIFDMWTTADLEALVAGDLADGMGVITRGTDFSDAPTGSALMPGSLFYNIADNLMFCWFDEVDSTGVSLWLAIGPDRFDVPMIAAEPLPAAVPVEVVYDKWAGLPTEPTQMPIGFNQSGITNSITRNVAVDRGSGPEFGGETAASGAWFRCAIEGNVFGQQTDPDNQADPSIQDMQAGLPISMDLTDPLSLVASGSWGGTNRNPVGMALYESNGPNPATEAPHTLKFRFDPRITRGLL